MNNEEISMPQEEVISDDRYPRKNYILKHNPQKIDSPETLEAIENTIKSNIDLNSTPLLNREQRRFLEKKAGKQGRANTEVISEAAKKLTYIKLIQKLRELNETEEGENNDED